MERGDDNDSTIYFQSKAWPEHRFLSNFHIAPIVHNGIVYQTTEHFYQAQKAIDDDDLFHLIVNCDGPKEAKRLGAQVKIDKQRWEAIKDVIMLKALRLKFSQHDDLAEKLLATANVRLIEWAPWGDTYWGVDKNYQGQNKLGKLLMKVREELRVQYDRM